MARIKGETFRRLAVGLFAVLLYAILLVVPLGLTAEQQAVVALIVLIGILWFADVMPLFATSLLIPVLLVITVDIPQKEVLAAFADPIIGLFFGSFVLATALAKHGFDSRLAHVLLRLAKRSARALVFGFVALSALLGMWISNTATVSLLLPVILLLVPIRRNKAARPRFAKALLFACAMGAAVGGMATPVGTPPNAFAVRYLADEGIVLTFIDWLKFGLPLTILMVPIIWVLLMALFRPEAQRVPTVKHAHRTWTKEEVASILLLGVTIVMWLTEPLHGVPVALVAVAAGFACFGFGLLKSSDLARVPVHALILFGGGLALGDAMVRTGVTEIIVEQLVVLIGQQHPYLILLVLIIFAIAITTVASNTATAALLVPIVVSIAAAAGVPVLPLVVGTTLALSIDFISPVGTPPSALIHATGLIQIRDFLRVGSIVTVAAAGLIYASVLLLGL